MQLREWQFDGLVGPTHNYAGLAMGNMASAANAGAVSNPRKAAIQGLEKMRFVRNLGMPQAFLPPHYRPMLSELERLGFRGSLGSVLDEVYRVAPGVLAAVFSSSYMWAANAATVTPSVDNADGRLQVTPGNLVSHYHRSIETMGHWRNFKTIFRNESLFSVNAALPSVDFVSDESAANHMRISDHNHLGSINLFVYGRDSSETSHFGKFLPRQQRFASESIARLHGLSPKKCLFFQQSPEAVIHGVFHNDVIAMNTTSRMIIHEGAFIPEHQEQLRTIFSKQEKGRLYEVKAQELSIGDAVATYLFNSQLLDLGGEKIALVAPSECLNHAGVAGVIDRLIGDGIIGEAHYLDVRESMRNGGGPACLRLRIILNPEQEGSLHPSVVLTDATYEKLLRWVNTHYRDRLVFDDLRDPEFVKELDRAYRELEVLLGMPDLYAGYRLGERSLGAR